MTATDFGQALEAAALKGDGTFVPGREIRYSKAFQKIQ